ncbi:MAG TPA: T9SS type A sorting domain-containing protein [Bacteroidales bacterium]|nr:T9SS type A sorting domain-containing protein [Bacteroidales bacterium]
MKEAVETTEETTTEVNTTQTNSIATLGQNAPNPFNQRTQINYYLPETVKQAALYIFDMNGLQIRTIAINTKGNGSITLHASELNAGMYLYTLIADGKEVDTKRMILTK